MAHKKEQGPEAQDLESEADHQKTIEDTETDEFHNYKPPRRLLLLELIVIILLIILLLFEPNGFSAISMKGTDTVGLLSSCSGGTCTSWLGAPAGGSTTTAPAAGAAAEKRAPADITSTSTSASSPTTFHLQTGLAAFCSFILLLYAFIFHLLRLRTPPPREGTDPSTADSQKTSRLRRYSRIKLDAGGLKRFGYRVSRLFTGVNVVLLLCVCISAGVQASSAGFNTGFILLVIAWVLLFLVALMEFMDKGRRVRRYLMFKEGWRPSMGGSKKVRGEDLEQGKISRNQNSNP